MREKVEDILTSLIVIGFFGGVIFFFIGLGWETRKYQSQDEAVEAGHAEYYLDKDNERQWRWLPKPRKFERTVAVKKLRLVITQEENKLFSFCLYGSDGKLISGSLGDTHYGTAEECREAAEKLAERTYPKSYEIEEE